MNVAYHLHKLNKNPAVITRIGIDDKGKELMNAFSLLGVCTDFFQLDYEYETGKVYAHPNEHNEVVYDIVMPVAWDFIDWEDSFTNVGIPFSSFSALKSGSGHNKPASFDFLTIDD